MLLAKDSGGTTIMHGRVPYTWEKDGDVIEVPDDLGAELLGIRGGGYSEAAATRAALKSAAAAKAKADADAAAEAARVQAEADAETARDDPGADGDGQDAPKGDGA